jgi:hypothetical protein
VINDLPDMANLDILRRRLSNQHLARPQLDQPAEMVAWLCAVQAQDYPAAKWALAQRLKGATDASLDEAFNAGAILRTHVMRPTWHFVAPADIRWLLALTAPRVMALLARYGRQLQIDAALHRRSHAVLTRALQGGKQLTRTELNRALQAAGIERSNLGLGHIIMHAELDGLICSGPRRGKQFTYMLLEERVPPVRPLHRDEALPELIKRYFTSHGPAQAQDFVWWSGLTTADTKKGLDLVGSQLAHETVDGKGYWFAPSDPAPMPQTAYLLPNYDEYTIAYKDRSHFYDASAFQSPVARDNVPFAHMIVINGRIVGTWKRTLAKNDVRVEAKFLHAPSGPEQRALKTAVEQYGTFLNLSVELA